MDIPLTFVKNNFISEDDHFKFTMVLESCEDVSAWFTTSFDVKRANSNLPHINGFDYKSLSQISNVARWKREIAHLCHC